MTSQQLEHGADARLRGYIPIVLHLTEYLLKLIP
jgi:hypothetical protein